MTNRRPLAVALSQRLNRMFAAAERWLLDRQADRRGPTVTWTGPTSPALRALEYDDYVRSNMQPLPVPRAGSVTRRAH